MWWDVLPFVSLVMFLFAMVWGLHDIIRGSRVIGGIVLFFSTFGAVAHMWAIIMFVLGR